MLEITISAYASSFMALIASFTLFHDYYYTREYPRFEWGLGMLAYAIGHLVIGSMGFIIEASDFFFYSYLTISGAISMSLMLVGTLILFLANKDHAILIASCYGLFYFIGMVFFAWIDPSILPITPVLFGEVTNRTMTSWFVVETIIPISILIAYIMYIDLKQTKCISSFWISLHFFLYALLLFIWPFEELKLIFYIGRALTTGTILVGVRELRRKTIYHDLIQEAKSETAFLLDVLTHDIKGYVHGSKALLDMPEFTEESRNLLDQQLDKIYEVGVRVKRYRDIDSFNEIPLKKMNLVKIIKSNLKETSHNFPQFDLQYQIHLDTQLSEVEVAGNEFINDIFINLFQNSFKYHHKNKTINFDIYISEQPLDNQWKIRICDDGPGIQEPLISSLFSPPKGNNSIKQKGMGHLIILKTIKWFKGEIWAENIEKDGKIQGLQVTVLLPMFK